jgi:hypothetical protein
MLLNYRMSMIETRDKLRADEAVLTAAFRKLAPEARQIVLAEARQALRGQAGWSGIIKTKAEVKTGRPNTEVNG